MTDKIMAVLMHEDWDHGELYGSYHEARAALLRETAEYRDHCGPCSDAEWIDTCLSESWTIQTVKKGK